MSVAAFKPVERDYVRQQLGVFFSAGTHEMREKYG
jgi:hypothetical protein